MYSILQISQICTPGQPNISQYLWLRPEVSGTSTAHCDKTPRHAAMILHLLSQEIRRTYQYAEEPGKIRDDDWEMTDIQKHTYLCL